MTMRFSLQLDELAFSLQLQQSLLHGQQSCLDPALWFFFLSLNSNQTFAVKLLLLVQSIILHCSLAFFTFPGNLPHWFWPGKMLLSNSIFLIFLSATRCGRRAAWSSGSFLENKGAGDPCLCNVGRNPCRRDGVGGRWPRGPAAALPSLGCVPVAADAPGQSSLSRVPLLRLWAGEALESL